MSRLMLAVTLALLIAPGRARAQQPPPVTPQPPAAPQPPAVPLNVFLEQRVAEELAADGTLLSRLGVTLDVELIGQRAIVSLVDTATQRARASTKIDVLPADREAAVASVTQVAANLAAQIATPASQTTVAVKEMLDRDREDRREREAAEYRYRQEALTFGDEVQVSSDGKSTSVSRRWVAFQGDIRRRLDGEEFYKVIDRPDLAQQYETRRSGGIAALVGGSAAMLGGLIYMLSKTGIDCDIGAPDFDQCLDDHDRELNQAFLIGGAISAAGGIALLIGTYYVRNPHPISEGEAQTLGQQHNTELRRKYNLSTEASPRRRARNLVVTPYIGGDGGGLAIGGRF